MSDAAVIAELLSEANASLSDLEEHQGLGEDVLVRYWHIGQDYLDGAIEHLKTQTTVENPMAGTRWARTGIWYAGWVAVRQGNINPLVASGAQGLVWLVYQELSKGDKIITITEDCAAYTKTRIIHTYNPDVPSGVAETGQIVAVEASPTKLGRLQTAQETTIPKDQVATSGTETGMKTVVRITHTENPQQPTVPPGITAGQIKQVAANPTRAGNYETMEETDTAKAVSVPEYIARLGESETEYRSEEYHAAAAPDIMKFKDTGGTERTIELDANGNPIYDGKNISVAILHHELDEYLRHNYKKSRTVKKFPISDADNVNGISWDIFGDTESVTSQVYSERLGRYWNDKTYIYQLKTTHTIKYFQTIKEAAAWITTTYVTEGTQIDNRGSTFAPTGEFEVQAHRVINSKILRTTYTYLEPAE